MESVLINYDLKGKIIDFKTISYDEIAEGMFKIESRIELDKLTINSIADMEEKSEDIEVFKIDYEGKISPITQTKNAVEGINLIEEVILQLNINRLKIKYDLIVSKVQPHNPNETIIVLPEIVDEGELFYELNSHILLVDNTTGRITHKYFESHKTNNWVSDAIELREIKIDTAPYIVDENTRAFGIRVYYYGMSKPNPYSNETISLFVKSDGYLKNILNNYDVMNYGGEWDTNCDGEFLNVKRTLLLSKEKTNGYFNILVKNMITNTRNYEDENGDCESKEKISTETEWLKFNGEIYLNKKTNKDFTATIKIDKAKYIELVKKATKTIYKPKMISNIDSVKTVLRNRVEWFTNINKPNTVKSIITDNGKKLFFDINAIDFGFAENYSAYYPEYDILLLEGGHGTDVCFSIKTGETESTIGNPKYIIPSPKNTYRLNGYFGGQECISYFFQKKENRKFTYLTQFNGNDNSLCTFKEFYWIEETQFIYSKMNYSANSENGEEEYFKGEILMQ